MLAECTGKKKRKRNLILDNQQSISIASENVQQPEKQRKLDDGSFWGPGIGGREGRVPECLT